MEACDLLTGATPSTARVLIPVGDLDEETLAGAGDAPPGEVRFLRFVQAPLNPIELARFNNRPDRPRFKAPGRLARVGLLARMLDAGLVASLLVRGKVPGGTAAAAAIKYEAIRAADPRVSYHGRVIRQDGWVVLQYLFFYPMNDWRSTFDGANDHEADWEQAFVILEELPDGDVEPVWFAAAAHDEQGADLRRRWDDPKLQTEGEHVVVYPGAGSHATYMEQGEYIMRLALPGAALQRGILDWARRLWRDTLNQPDPGDLAESIARLVSVPFVDYARGDGYTVGPGQQFEWSPILIGDDDGWVDAYRGLWGLDTGDRMAGERAPAGPKYTRTGTVRQSWNDPSSFVGLAGAPTPAETREALVTRVEALRAERTEVDAEAAALAETLPGLSVEVRALAETSGVDAYRKRRAAELAEGEAKLASLRSRSAELRAAASGGRGYLARYDAGYRGDPAGPPLARRAPGTPEPDQAAGVRRDLGGAERGRAGAGPGVHPVVPHPAGRSHGGPAGDRLPGDRVVRPATRGDAAAARDRRPGHGLGGAARDVLRAGAGAAGAGRARPVHPDRQRPGADPPLTGDAAPGRRAGPARGRGGHARDGGDVA